MSALTCVTFDRLKLDDLKVASEEGEDPMALHEHEPCSLEGDGLRDGTVTPETPVRDTPPVVILSPQPPDSNVTVRGRRRGTHDITASSPSPITVTPPTPGMCTVSNVCAKGRALV